MSLILTAVRRTCTEVLDERSGNEVRGAVQFESLRALDAYVLLGDPGAGKTFVFSNEAAEPGCHYISARDFLTLTERPEWKGSTLFIDGLDETRAGGEGRTPLDNIRARLERIGGALGQRFRISCRETDWLGASDLSGLKRVAPGNSIRVFRLDPLSDEQAEYFLESHLDLTRGNPKRFLESAREHGLEQLLRNPQTLILLSKSLGTSGWPASREEVFRLACEKLVTEPNTEHQVEKRRHSRVSSVPELFSAAGYLSALHLIADIKGFAIGGPDVEGAADLNEIKWKDLPLHDVVRTRVFSASLGPFVPIHRTIAEYLGAAFLAEAVRGGLSVRRVLALISGADGGVVAGLRGLHAWLAFHLPEHRLKLSAADPLGVTLYGAAGSFTVSEKQRLLESIAEEIERPGGHALADGNTTAAVALVTDDMVEPFQAIIERPSRLQKDQALTRFVLEALEEGHPLPSLGTSLLRVVRDSSRWLSVRREALRAFMHVQPGDVGSIQRLANDLRDGKVEDSNDELLAELLYKLFPVEISPLVLLSYLHPAKKHDYIGTYRAFWNYGIGDLLDGKGASALLDAMADNGALLSDWPVNQWPRRFVGLLLVKALQSNGDAIAAHRLFSWLGVRSGNGAANLENDDRVFVRSWLEERPKTYRELLLRAAELARSQQKDFRMAFFGLRTRFCGARIPPGMPEVWLHLAEKDSDFEFAQSLFREAVRPLFHEGNTEYSVEYFESWVATRPTFAPALEAERYVEWPSWRAEREDKRREWEKEEQQERRDLAAKIRKELFERDTPHPRAIHDLARAFFGHLLEADGDFPAKRLSHLFDRDESLIAAALRALVASVRRVDLPSIDDILSEAAKDRMHFVRLPCLAGMEEIFRNDQAEVDAMDDAMLSKMIAFRYTEGTGNEPDWLTHVVRTRPKLVAEVVSSYGVKMLQSGKERVHGLWQLAFEPAYSSVAALAVPRLLEAFPSVLRKGQAEALEYILKAAFRYCSPALIRNAVARGLRRRLDVAQRVYWLACGVIIDPKKYSKALERQIGTSHERREHLGEFLTGREARSVLPADVSSETLSLLVRLLGPGCNAELPEGWVTATMRTGELVRSLIDRLSNIADETAGRELASLLSLPTLSEWRFYLQRASHAQQIYRREKSFRHPSPAQLIETLRKLRPANAADLAAMVLDTLEDLALEIERGDANGYRAYWNVDSHNRPKEPKPEEGCRDLLLSRLRDRLKMFGIDIQREGNYVNDKRADLKVTYNVQGLSINLPIEIKRDRHRAVWSAISKQLPLYTVDPDASGQGIYVVFWFGGERMPPPPTGKRPRSAEDLRTQLQATIETQYRALISVVTFDCEPKNDLATVK